MAYDEYMAERVTRFFNEKKVDFFSKKMMGGLCFMVDEKMACGIHYDKTKKCDLLMARIGKVAHDINIEKWGCYPMDFTGKPMSGYVFITPDAYDSDEDLSYWLQLCLDFNPHAKKSAARKKKE